MNSCMALSEFPVFFIHFYHNERLASSFSVFDEILLTRLTCYLENGCGDFSETNTVKEDP